jgi:uncharacterized SAM-binding protein YcdF (DUF218 family)
VAGVGWLVFSSAGATWCLAIAALWVVASRGSRASRRFLVVCAVGYWLAGMYIVPETLRSWLTHGYAPLTRAAVPAGRTAVVLLGSGSYQFRDWSEGQFVVVDRVAAARLLEAARVFRLIDADFIVSSGGLIQANPRNWPSGVTMADDLVRLGIPRDRISVESESKTTRHEAVLIKDLLRTHPVDHVVLVTSQFHMRRSVGTFRAVGLDVIPAIAREPDGVDEWWEKLIPTDKGMEESGMAAHELAGIVTYAARGWFRWRPL